MEIYILYRISIFNSLSSLKTLAIFLDFEVLYAIYGFIGLLKYNFV